MCWWGRMTCSSAGVYQHWGQRTFCKLYLCDESLLKICIKESFRAYISLYFQLYFLVIYNSVLALGHLLTWWIFKQFQCVSRGLRFCHCHCIFQEWNVLSLFCLYAFQCDVFLCAIFNGFSLSSMTWCYNGKSRVYQSSFSPWVFVESWLKVKLGRWYGCFLCGEGSFANNSIVALQPKAKARKE